MIVARTTDDGFIARLINVQGPCTTPLDAAIEYMRARIERIAPWYVLAMAPHAIVTVLLIDVIIAGQRSRIAPLCLWLLAATLWRWACLARLQQDVLRDLGQAGDVRLWSRLPAIICVRMASNVGITWGSIALGVPAFYGLFMGGFVAPLLLESRDPAVPRVRACMSWITHAGRRLLRVTLVMTLIILVGTIAAFVSQMVLANTVLSSLLGIDTADLNVTLGSWAWRLRVFYGLFLLFDVYWTVACVFLYYDSQSRRTATDLRVRLTDLTKAGA